MAEKEYIERGALFAELRRMPMFERSEADNGMFYIERSILESFPTADVVEVVRCKDCKHSYFVNSCSKYECRKGCGTLKYSTDFCSYGERRDQK